MAVPTSAADPHRSGGDAPPRCGEDEPTVLASWTATVVQALNANGLDGETLARRAGIDPVLFHRDGARIPLSCSSRLWRSAVAATGDPCFSLQVATFVRPSTFSGLGMGMVTSPSFREALERLGRFHGVAITQGGTTSVSENDGHLVWGFRPSATGPRPCHEALEAIAATITLCGRLLAGPELAPAVVHLMRPEPPPASRFERFFRCPVRYGASEYRLSFDVDTIDQRPPSGSAIVSVAADRVARNDLEAVSPDLGFAAEVRDAVVRLLTGPDRSGGASTARVAEQVAVSPRTLQRRLRSEGTTLRRLVSEVRVDLARELLVIDRISVDAVATRLGFHDAASFRRAFKRRTGTTPADYVASATLETDHPAARTETPDLGTDEATAAVGLRHRGRRHEGGQPGALARTGSHPSSGAHHRSGGGSRPA